MNDNATWFYEANGDHVGPVSAAALRRKFVDGGISENTLCWEPAFGATWKALRETPLAEGLVQQRVTPPPLPTAPVTTPAATSGPPVANIHAWTIALMPVVLGIAGVLLSTVMDRSEMATNGAYWGTMFFTIRADRRDIVKAGYPRAPSTWWVLLTPVYLWKRATILGRPRTHFWVQILSGVLLAVVAVAADKSDALGALGLSDLPSCQAVEGTAFSVLTKSAGVQAMHPTRLLNISGTGVQNGVRLCTADVATGAGTLRAQPFRIYEEKGDVYVAAGAN